MASLFKTDLQQLKGVGKKRIGLFNKLSVNSVGALLKFYPRDYKDFTNQVYVKEATLNEVCCIRATVIRGFRRVRIKNNITIYKCKVCDGFTNMTVTLFNNKYKAQKIKENEEYLFLGKLVHDFGVYSMTSPEIEPVCSELKIRPVYSQTEGLSSYMIEEYVKQALKMLPENIEDSIPEHIREEFDLCDLKFAIKNIHFPESKESLRVAKRRMAFEDILIFRIGVSLIKSNTATKSYVEIENSYFDDFKKLLKFKLTNAQSRVIDECLSDMMSKGYSMNRLIQGDVGCGKTIIAAALCFCAAKNGMQSAFMAPTEILSNQHYIYLKELFKNTGIKVQILTSSTSAKDRKTILGELESGNIDILVGTHSLISEEVKFLKLALVITDEQHRFGVKQRMALGYKGKNPHLLVMSATPIPRTLALVVYCDLDISIVDEMPLGRKKISTYSIGSNKRLDAFNFVGKLIEEGRQAYIVCPVIENSKLDMHSIESYINIVLNSNLSKYKIGVIHGKLKDSEKQEVMFKFLSGEIQILLSTTVIEVGIDVKNAAVIIIENAERFGLSQLHQLRGRVGRGQYDSYCILISDSDSEETLSRLKIMCSTNDGFEISKQDLKLRGPGDFFGTRQHGLIDVSISSLLSDTKLFSQASGSADRILAVDPDLSQKEHIKLKNLAKFKIRICIQ